MIRENILQFMSSGNKSLFIPKNGGLFNYVIGMLPEIGLDIEYSVLDKIRSEKVGSIELNGLEILLARGEDIPQRVQDGLRSGKETYGLTGDDLFDEWRLQRIA